jgi:hypothetical protein
VNRRSFLRTISALTAPLAILPEAVAHEGSSSVQGIPKEGPQSERARRIEKATVAALAMQRRDWEDGRFWGGGNGWAAAGLARVWRSLPTECQI